MLVEPSGKAIAALVSTRRGAGAVDSIFNNGSNNVTLNDWIFKSSNDIKPSPKRIVVTI